MGLLEQPIVVPRDVVPAVASWQQLNLALRAERISNRKGSSNAIVTPSGKPLYVSYCVSSSALWRGRVRYDSVCLFNSSFRLLAAARRAVSLFPSPDENRLRRTNRRGRRKSTSVHCGATRICHFLAYGLKYKSKIKFCTFQAESFFAHPQSQHLPSPR
jgi:hypothetical protein